MSDQEMDAESFLRSLENQNGGPLEWKTYAFYLGAAGEGNPRSLGGLMYVVAGRIFFEDFERENSLLKLFGRRQKYEKFKIEAPLASLKECRSVSAFDARRVINGKLAAEQVSPLGSVQKIIHKRTEELLFDDGSAWFLEMYDRGGLDELMKGKEYSR